MAHGKLISIVQSGAELTLYNVTIEEFNALWCHYFALDEDYDAIDEALLENCQNPTFVKALE